MGPCDACIFENYALSIFGKWLAAKVTLFHATSLTSILTYIMKLCTSTCKGKNEVQLFRLTAYKLVTTSQSCDRIEMSDALHKVA